MLTEIETLRDELKSWVAALDVPCIDGRQAARVVSVCAEIERVAAAAKMLATARVEVTGVWANSGAKSPADWLAKVSGTGLNAAIHTVAVARAIEELPGTQESLRNGTLSIAQASEVARGAAHDPGAEARLLAAARQGFAEVKREATRVKAEVRSSEEESDKLSRQRSLRSMTFWNDDDGMACGMYRLEPKAGIAVRKLIEAEANRQFEIARKAGRRDTTPQYAADAFAHIVTGGPGTPGAPGPTESRASERSVVKAEVVAIVDYEALLRGHVEVGEQCEIPGVGPISVAAAQDYLLGGAFLKVLIAKGVDVRTVCHYGRYIPAELRTAIAYRDPGCVVAGCARHMRLESHHVEAVANNGETSLFNIRRVCDHDHDLVTHRGFSLGPPDERGKCQLIPPSNPNAPPVE